MNKVVKIPLIVEQNFDKEGNEVEYKEIYKILWCLQGQTRDFKNKAIQLAWEWMNFASEYNKKEKEYPKEKEILDYTLSGYIYDKLKNESNLYSANLAATIIDATNSFQNSKKEMLKGEKSVLSYKSNQPIELYNKAIGLSFKEDDFCFSISLLNKKGCEEYNMKKGKIVFKAFVKDKSTKAILERLVDKEYKISGSKLIYNKKKKIWELNLVYGFENKQSHNLDENENKVLGIDLGIVHPVYASIYGETKRFIIEGGEIENFRKKTESRRISLLRQTKHCGDGRIGHGIKTRCKPAYDIADKIARFRDTVNHKYSRSLISFAERNNCGVIQMEKLTGITNQSNEYLNKYLKDWSYFDLQTKIEYKAKEKGIKVVYVEPQYTTQRCSKCGKISVENVLTQADFKCVSCGYSENADYNASQNIAIKDIDKIIEAEIKKNTIV